MQCLQLYLLANRIPHQKFRAGMEREDRLEQQALVVKPEHVDKHLR